MDGELVQNRKDDYMTDRLKTIIGEELKYKDLCSKLNIEYKRGNAKNAQLKNIELYCDLQVLSSPTRYKVNEVYDKELVKFNSNTKLQEEIEDVIIQLLQLNNFNVLYITKNQLLVSLYLVNENYIVLKNPKLRRSLEKVTNTDYYDLYLSADKSGDILMKWVDRALDRMEKRGLILYRRGYCLHKEVNIGDCIVRTKYEVPSTNPNEDGVSIEQRIHGCYRQALESLGLGGFNGYVPIHLKNNFNEKFNILVKEEFNGEYDGAYKTKIIIPADPKRVKSFSDVKTKLNEEAQRKIRETAQLDCLTGTERKKLLDEIISIDSPIVYKDEILKGKKNV